MVARSQTQSSDSIAESGLEQAPQSSPRPPTNTSIQCPFTVYTIIQTRQEDTKFLGIVTAVFFPAFSTPENFSDPTCSVLVVELTTLHELALGTRNNMV